jgi:hypothetical protein
VLQSGISDVRDEAEELWRVIDNGSMPPGKAGDRADLPWTDKTGTVNMMLTGLDLAEARDKVRNWLACAAPIVAATNDAPLKDQLVGWGAIEEPGTPPAVTSTWTSVYTNVLSACSGCHSASPIGNQALNLSNKEVAYMQLVDKPAYSGSGAACSGRTLVKTNDCANSLLYQKLQPPGSAPGLCGVPMPMGGTPISATALKSVCDWINAGALNN